MLALAAIISATETAITATSPGKMQKIKSGGNKRAEIILGLIKTKEKVISTLLIGYSITITVCTTIATKLFISLIGEGRGTVASSIIMSFLIIVFAEVIPKAIAVIKAEKIVLFTLPAIMFFLKLLKPINAMLEVAVRLFCFIFRINLTQDISGTDEVRGVIEHHHQEGNVYKSDRDMLGGVLDIRDMIVSEIMIHRSDIVAINASLSNEEIVRATLSSPHSRIPIWKDSKDNIIGILHIRDLLRALYENNNDPKKIDIKELMKHPWFVPDNALVVHQLNAFRERNNHFACVVDEYGDLQGIITLEDILEEIVGPIHDEHDCLHPTMLINKKSDSEFIISGSMTIRDINRELNWNLPDEYSNTIAGLIIHEIERIPNQGETIEIFDLKVTIIKKVANRVETIKITIPPPKDILND